MQDSSLLHHHHHHHHPPTCLNELTIKEKKEKKLQLKLLIH